MPSKLSRLLLMVGAMTTAMTLAPISTPAQAQGWSDGSSCWGLKGRDRTRCERDRDRGNWNSDRSRRSRERERRKDAKTDGVVAGVVGTVLVGGIIAAVATSGKKKDKNRDRREYCEDRYGNYDERSDSYRAADGQWYRCE